MNSMELSVIASNKSVNSGSAAAEVFHCNTGYLMNALGLALQFLLAVLAFTSLICKLYRGITYTCIQDFQTILNVLVLCFLVSYCLMTFIKIYLAHLNIFFKTKTFLFADTFSSRQTFKYL